MRVWSYEKKLGEGKGGELVRECWKELRNRMKRGKVIGGWEEERKEFMERGKWNIEEIEKIREMGKLKREESRERERRIQRKERWGRMRGSTFNKWYGKIKGKGLPNYLKKEWRENRWQSGEI